MPDVNPADPRVRRTRKLLQAALVELLAEKSFETITVQDIAERSTINRATFYAHFVDKYELFAGISRDWFHTALQQRLPAAAGFSRVNLQLLTLASMQALAEMNDHCPPTEILKPLVMSAVQEELAQLLLGWLRGSGPVTLPPGVSLETVAAGVSWTIFGTAVDWSRMADRSAAEPTAAHVAQLLADGLTGVVGEHAFNASA